MADVYDLADRFRAEILRRERQAATELVRAYGAVWRRIRRRLDDLGEQIAQARRRGEDVSPAWLLQEERLQTLQRQVEAEISQFARFAESRIISEQHDAVQAAQQHAEQLMLAGLGEPPPGVTVTFARLPASAVQDLVGFLQDGSPLRDLLDELGPEASKQVRQALITGGAMGQHPTWIARQLRSSLGGNLVRALTIARTEVLRAYREASRRTYQANRDVVEGWIWHSAAQTRTCAFCWSMHGSVHRLDEPFASHPRCRCSPVPLTKTWRDLGFPDVPETRAQVTPGPELFARLPEDQQRAILGPAKFAAYRAGAISLEDLRGFRRDPRWGRVGYERSLVEIVGAAEARRWLERGVAGRVLPPIAGGAESPQERIERLVTEDKMPRVAVERAEQIWRERLRSGVRMPNGEMVQVTLDDLYHVIVDDRIWRHPERIEAALTHVFEIRALERGNRLAFSRWSEGEQDRLAALILYPDGTLRALHPIDKRRMRRYLRKPGETLWKR